MRAPATVGVNEWEKLAPQMVELDIEFAVDNDAACASDKLKDTVDYGEVYTRVREALTERHFQLLEACADHLARIIIAEFHAASARVSIAKLEFLPGVKQVGVTIQRER